MITCDFGDQFEPDSMVGYRVNRVKSLVHLWYAFFEVHSFDTHQELLGLCSEDGFELQLGPAKITTAEAFEMWYRAIFGRFTRSYHDIHAIEVTLVSERFATAFIRFTHTINLDGQTQVFDFSAQMRVIETDRDGPKVLFYQPELQAP